MKTISINKIEIVEVEILQREISHFLNYQNNSLVHIKAGENLFFDALLFIDIATKLYYNFRSKIEKTTKGYCKITLSISEAILVLQVANFKNTLRDDVTDFTILKISNLVHSGLINLQINTKFLIT